MEFENIIIPAPKQILDAIYSTDLENIIIPAPKQILDAIYFTDQVIEDTGNIEIEKTINDFNGYDFKAPEIQVYLYKNSKNKTLFAIDKFYPIPRYFSSNSKDEKYISNLIKQQFQTNLTAKLYRTTNPPINIEDMAQYFTDIPYKIFDLANDQYSFEDYLEVNKDYFYILRVNHADGENYFGAGDRFSDVIRVKIIKENDTYFLDKEVIYFDKLIEQKPTIIFSRKLFIEPNFKNEDVKILITELQKAAKDATQIVYSVDLQNSTFKFGQASFDSASNYPYIKLRLTSKKTNRKIDINLNYTFLQTIKVINEQELKSKNTIKINEQ